MHHQPASETSSACRSHLSTLISYEMNFLWYRKKYHPLAGRDHPGPSFLRQCILVRTSGRVEQCFFYIIIIMMNHDATLTKMRGRGGPGWQGGGLFSCTIRSSSHTRDQGAKVRPTCRTGFTCGTVVQGLSSTCGSVGMRSKESIFRVSGMREHITFKKLSRVAEVRAGAAPRPGPEVVSKPASARHVGGGRAAPP